MAKLKNFRIEGVEQFISEVEKLNINIRNKATAGALRAGANVLAKRARELAPVHAGPYPKGHYKRVRVPGTLKKSIKGRAVGGSIKNQTGSVKGTLNVFDPIWHLLESGHKTRAGQKLKRNVFSRLRKGRFKEGAKRFVSPRPYLRPAIDQRTDAALSAIGKVLARYLAKQTAAEEAGGE